LVDVIDIGHFFYISRELMCILAVDGCIEKINPAFEKILGYTSDEVTGKSVFRFVHPDDLEQTRQKINELHTRKTAYPTFINRTISQTGKYHWLAWRSIDIVGERIFAIARDVTLLKQKKELLRDLNKNLLKQSDLWDTVLNGIPQFVCILNEKMQFMYVNQTAALSMGLPQGRFIGKTLEDLSITYNNLEEYREEIHGVFQTGRQVLNTLSIIIDGQQKDMEYSIIPIFNDGTVISVIYTARDITDKNRDRRNFEASEKKLKKIIDLVPYPIFLKDKTCRYTLINKAQADLFNTTFENIIGKTDEEFISDKNELDSVIVSDKKILREQVNFVLPEQIITGKDGKKIILHTTKIPFLNQVDGSVNILGISIDITTAKNSEEELLRTNFELDSFVYKSSHDLRAPLRSLIGLINLIYREQDPEMRNHILDRCNASIHKLDTFISELTNFSRNSRLEITATRIDFHAIINECIENLKFMDHAQRIEIFINVNDVYPFYSDQARMTILFMNLISNAIKYQNTQTERSYVNIEVYTSEQEALIQISDNGIGIEKEFHHKIFEMFFRASEYSFGSGLGLYIVKQVIDKLYGKITVESTPGKGAAFKVILPSLQT
jgi:PAS domain S-box-containing protein